MDLSQFTYTHLFVSALSCVSPVCIMGGLGLFFNKSTSIERNSSIIASVLKQGLL